MNERRQTMKMSIAICYVKREILLACVILCEMLNFCRTFKWCLHLYVYWGNNSQKNCPIQSFSDLIKNFLNDFMSSTLSLWLMAYSSIRDTQRSRSNFSFYLFFHLILPFWSHNFPFQIAYYTTPTTRKNEKLNDEEKKLEKQSQLILLKRN